ncbi:MAG TPA: thiamine-phosphate kinase, partial [Dongiaceae bacterium]|nr:thiamine-phosphate kinase [Dongiaceae bacterium]
GGEDYELLFTARPEWEGLLAGLVRRLRVPVTRIGSVRPAREGIRLLTPEGRYRPLPPAAFEHFRKSGR